MTIARWGWTNILATTLLALWVLYLLPCGWPQLVAAVPLGLVWLFVVAFFRNPTPVIPEDERILVSPGTGVVSDIEEVDEEHFIGGKAIRIGIFLSVFDVHVNRSPLEGTIDYVHYKPGKFLDARHPNATHHNEANTLGIVAADRISPGLKIVVRQISGLIARRIICVFAKGEALKRGELYGMIKFGSRTELFFPVTVAHELQVSIGQKVKCGETPLITLTASKETKEV